MRLFRRWFTAPPSLTAEQAARLATWDRLPAGSPQTGVASQRCIVVDVETTGLNLVSDHLISIGAVAVVDGRIALGDSFYVVLQQQESSRKENILVHGISGTVQREGMDPAEAMLAFLEFMGKSPLVAFHVAFDETMIRRALRQYLGITFKHPWLDLAYVMPALNPTLIYSHRVLDDWVRRFDIRIDARHNALADALATAQLLQVAQGQARKKNISGYAGMRDLEKAYRWNMGIR